MKEKVRECACICMWKEREREKIFEKFGMKKKAKSSPPPTKNKTFLECSPSNQEDKHSFEDNIRFSVFIFIRTM